ncbi:hypothetical protein QYM36_017575, partial [Artemia franciscana]
MYVKSMVIDGFKSYGQRTEINGFDHEFNAITGLNGSGKSNILDAICFLLGITNLSHVRATNLQELVYKNGTAGITKASVSITFDNSDKLQSPLGYDHFDEITITRQIVVGGKNKYLINGVNAQNNKVQDLFRSVQLNVNNPHFLIMQGRITKVLNMKPPEILGMLEEAAGTKMYEVKKQQAEKTIEKKDAKLREIEEVIMEDITPTINKLKEDRSQYLNYQKIQRELEHYQKIYIAQQFVMLEERLKKASDEYQIQVNEIDNLKKACELGTEEIASVEEEILELQQKKEGDAGQVLSDLEAQLKESVKEQTKMEGVVKSLQSNIKDEEKKANQLEKGKKDDLKVLNARLKEEADFKSNFDSLIKENSEAQENLQLAERRRDAINRGLFVTASGEDATLAEQLMKQNEELRKLQTEMQTANMRLKDAKEKLKKKEPELKDTEKEWKQNQEQYQKLENDVKSLEKQLGANAADKYQLVEQKKVELSGELRNLRDKLSHIEDRYSSTVFQYRDPTPNFDRRRVKGMFCNLFKVKDPAFYTAIEVAAGGRLYNVVVEDDETSKLLIEKGQLRNRTTFIPLNKIQAHKIDDGRMQYAKNKFGKNDLFLALDLIEFDPGVRSAVEYVFGNTLIATTGQIAKQACYDNRLRRRCISLEGDDFSPSGTLTGGSRGQGSKMLEELGLAMELRSTKEKKEEDFRRLDNELSKLKDSYNNYMNKRQVYDKKVSDLQILKERIEGTSHFRLQQEIEGFRKMIADIEQGSHEMKEKEKELKNKVKDLEYKVKNAESLKKQEEKEAEENLALWKDKASRINEKWAEKEQRLETLKLEIEELKKVTETADEQIAESKKLIEELKNNLDVAKQKAKEQEVVVKEKQDRVKAQKDLISKSNAEITKKTNKIEQLKKKISEHQLQIKQLDLKLSKHNSDVRDAEIRVNEMMKKYDFINEDRQFFGQPDSQYDFRGINHSDLQKRVASLQEQSTKLSRNVNARAMTMLGQAEEE